MLDKIARKPGARVVGDKTPDLAQHLGWFRDLAPDARSCCDGARFEALTGGRAPGQEDPDSFLRKGVAGDWRNWFDADLNAAYVALAGPLLANLGYALS